MRVSMRVVWRCRRESSSEGSRLLHLTDLVIVPGLNPPAVILPGHGAEWHLLYRYEASSLMSRMQRVAGERENKSTRLACTSVRIYAGNIGLERVTIGRPGITMRYMR
jgi:hypothetical protein